MSLHSQQRKKLLLRIMLLFTECLLKVLIATPKLVLKKIEPKFAIALKNVNQ